VGQGHRRKQGDAVSAPVAEVWALVCELGVALGLRDLSAVPGCWRHELADPRGGTWAFALNPHAAPELIGDTATELPPFHMLVEWNGFPAGIVGPAGGVIAAGALANEDTCIAALKAETARVRAARLSRSAPRCAHGMYPESCAVRSCEHFDGIAPKDAIRLRRDKSHGGRTRDREQRAARVLRSRKAGA
jgi:hypothetical protein